MNNTKPTKTYNEQQLITNAKSGDEQAFTDLINENLPKVRASLQSSFGILQKADIDDAQNLAIFKTFKQIKTFKEKCQFSTWFQTIFKNEILNILETRKNINYNELSLDALIKAENKHDNNNYDKYPDFLLNETILETGETMLKKKEEIEEIKESINYAFSKLGLKHKGIFNEIFIKQNSYRQASINLGVSVGNIMSGTHYLRKRMQKSISAYARNNNIELGVKYY